MFIIILWIFFGLSENAYCYDTFKGETLELNI